jgi:hypothetical protein
MRRVLGASPRDPGYLQNICPACVSRKSTLRPVSASGVPIYQLRIELQDLKPLIWRSVLVPGSIKLSKLHVVVQRTMGWMGGHLDEFIL